MLKIYRGRCGPFSNFSFRFRFGIEKFSGQFRSAERPPFASPKKKHDRKGGRHKQGHDHQNSFFCHVSPPACRSGAESDATAPHRSSRLFLQFRACRRGVATTAPQRAVAPHPPGPLVALVLALGGCATATCEGCHG